MEMQPLVSKISQVNICKCRNYIRASKGKVTVKLLKYFILSSQCVNGRGESVNVRGVNVRNFDVRGVNVRGVNAIGVNVRGNFVRGVNFTGNFKSSKPWIYNSSKQYI